MTRRPTYQYFGDKGHGWLAVSRSELKRLGLIRKISRYSYQQGGMAYLEEDSDAQTFLDAKQLHDEPFRLRYYYRPISPIRNLEPYRAV